MPLAAVTHVAAVAELSIGVRWTRPTSRSRAASISAIGTRWSDDGSRDIRRSIARRVGRVAGTCVLAQAMIWSSVMLDQLIDQPAVSAEPERLRYAAVARAFSDPKRLCVLESLASGELSVGDLSTQVGCQVPNMSQHLAVLRSAGLVTTRREGSTVFYRLTDPRVLEAYRLIQDIAR